MYERVKKWTKDLTDEFRDRRFYKAWAVYCQLKPNLKTKTENKNVFKELMKQAKNENINIDDIWKDYFNQPSKTEKEFKEEMKKDLNKEAIKFFNPKVYEKINPPK
jgi:hypothetical protein